MEVKNIEKSYGKKSVLRDVSFFANSGECIGILGGNGSGKSTLLGILAGVIKCDSGSFTHLGKDLLCNTKLRASHVGYIPQSTPLFEELSALDNLRLWYTGEEIKRELAGGVLELLGIGDFLGTTVGKMSGGMKKRLAIGCCVSGNPDILLMDEPSSALDLVCKESVYRYIESVKNKGGTVILTTHDIREITLCDRLFILKNGVLIQYDYDGAPVKLISELKA